MCSVFGALITSATPMRVVNANRRINHIMTASRERGRDGWGYHVGEDPYSASGFNYERKSIVRGEVWPDDEFFNSFALLGAAHLIGNMRAEPTTEYVAEKHDYDQQPYRLGKWTIVHNGTIANDIELSEKTDGCYPSMIDSGRIVELLEQTETSDVTLDTLAQHFASCIRQLKGSYAILAAHDDHRDAVFAACNYRPIWFAFEGQDTYFASSRGYFPNDLVPQMVEPYSMWCFTPRAEGGRYRLDDVLESKGKALVVCSGGMDSVVAATAMLDAGWDVELIHFRYGSRAEGPEVSAVHAVANHLGVNLIIHALNTYSPLDSPLLQADSKLAGGEAGAEFAHEWVPARNLLLLATATAIAEARGFDALVLGNNLEEAGAYPDNEPEFISRFNDLLPFAVGDGKKLKVHMPVGNLMKHEIVALGHQLRAPLHLTWSCYRSGPTHCGKCGPCFMRKTAFEINKLDEVIQYASKED